MSFGEERGANVITQHLITFAEERGLSVEALCDAVGMSGHDRRKLMRGDRTLSADEYAMLCDLLGVRPSQLIDCAVDTS